MKIEQRQWRSRSGWSVPSSPLGTPPDLVLVFGALARMQEPERAAEWNQFYGATAVIGCSTAGEICGVEVLDDSIVATAMKFDRSRVMIQWVKLSEAKGS